MLVWVSWDVIEADDQTGEPGSIQRVAMVSTSPPGPPPSSSAAPSLGPGPGPARHVGTPQR